MRVTGVASLDVCCAQVKRGVLYTWHEAEGKRLKNPFDTITEGVGLNRLTANFAAAAVDDAVRVTDREAVEMAAYLLRCVCLMHPVVLVPNGCLYSAKHPVTGCHWGRSLIHWQMSSIGAKVCSGAPWTGSPGHALACMWWLSICTRVSCAYAPVCCIQLSGVQHVETWIYVYVPVCFPPPCRNDGLFVGSSAAVNCVGAVKAARALRPGHTIVTVLCDGGARHLSKFHSPSYLQDMGLTPEATGTGLQWVKED